MTQEQLESALTKILEKYEKSRGGLPIGCILEIVPPEFSECNTTWREWDGGGFGNTPPWRPPISKVVAKQLKGDIKHGGEKKTRVYRGKRTVGRVGGSNKGGSTKV